MARRKTLDDELEELERSDPAVARARQALDDLLEVFARHDRHMAAREAVGVRPAQDSITCPVCGMTSYNPNDIREGFCGNCHAWTTERRT